MPQGSRRDPKTVVRFKLVGCLSSFEKARNAPGGEPAAHPNCRQNQTRHH